MQLFSHLICDQYCFSTLETNRFDHSRKYHNIPVTIILFVCHPKILHKHCLQLLLGPFYNVYAKFWGDKQKALWHVIVFSGVVNWFASRDVPVKSSETQGQIVGARESLNGREKMARRKVKNWGRSPLGTMSYQTSSKQSRPFWLLTSARKRLCFSARSERRPYGPVFLDTF